MNLRSTALFLSFVLPPGLGLVAVAYPQHNARHTPKKAKAQTVHPIAPETSAAFSKDVLPVVQQFCVGCHSGAKPAAGITLSGYKDTEAVIKDRVTWEKVSKNVNAGHMPPEGAPQPTPQQREGLVTWIDTTLSKIDCQLQDPGRVTMRRLNREEYNNTVRDLLGVSIRPADAFPIDDVGYGFDNIGDVLSLSPMLMEKYLHAAEQVAEAAIITPESANQPTRFTAKQLNGSADDADKGGRMLASEGELSTDFACPKEGTYTLTAHAYGEQAGPEPAKMAFRLDGKDVKTVDVAAIKRQPGDYTISVQMPAGKHQIGLAFVNDYYVPANGNQPAQDRNLVILGLDIQSPPHRPENLPASHRRLITAMPSGSDWEPVARKILTPFAARAYRRPVTKPEVDRLVRCVLMAKKEGESFERGVQLAVEATLISPSFLFRVEPDAKPNDPQAKRLLNDYELASRLSYFLWSSMPDTELFTLAAKGKLRNPDVLAAQTLRMIKDSKARALANNFAGQWLQLKGLTVVSPDPRLFPTFNNKLRDAMRTETEMFFLAMLQEDHSLLDFIDGRFTFLNEALAKHYGIPGVSGDYFRRVTLDDDQRGGILSQASILTVTSNPTRTSPVKRGKWVLEQLLGTPPPPPPPGVGELKEGRRGQLTGTLRQRMEEHRKNPACAACHARMDPIGFGLENYDAVGAWRTQEGDQPIDTSGTLPDGNSFHGPAQLKAILKAKKAQFVHTFCEKMMTYALGRGLESYDRCNLDEMAKTVARKDYHFSALMTQIVLSDPFRKRRGDGGRG